MRSSSLLPDPVVPATSACGPVGGEVDAHRSGGGHPQHRIEAGATVRPAPDQFLGGRIGHAGGLEQPDSPGQPGTGIDLVGIAVPGEAPGQGDGDRGYHSGGGEPPSIPPRW